MHTLVTGGFGFIGTHLTRRLLRDPRRTVHVVDNLSTSTTDPAKFVEDLEGAERLTFDISTVKDYCSTRRSAKFDQVFHLASVVGPVGVLQHAGRIAQSIVVDGALITDLAVECGARLVDVSTSEVYGGGRDGYCSERDFKVIQAESTVRLEYAVGKLAGEIATLNRSKVSALHVSIVRPFNVAGPGQSGKGGFVLPRFIGQALSGEPLTVYGDGRMIRAFTHVADIVEGLILVMESGQSGEVYNLGNPANKTSILQLAERVVRLTKSPSAIRFVDPKEIFGPLFAEANDKYPDADKAMNGLRWIPQFDLDAIIDETTASMSASAVHITPRGVSVEPSLGS